MTDSLKTVRTRPASKFDPAKAPQTVRTREDQVKNHEGGYVFAVNDMERAKRFLILGSEKNFYTSGQKLSKDNADVITKLASDPEAGIQLVDLITEISVAGRAPKQNPALFALAVAASSSEESVRSYALSKLQSVARTATHLFIFAGYVEQFRGWGRALRRAIAEWYTSKTADNAAYQAVKYQSREGYSHRDLFRLSHPVTEDEAFKGLGEWILRGDTSKAPRIVQGFTLAFKDGADVPALIREYGLTWEMIPTQELNKTETWDALAEGNLPLGALIRQLPRLTRIGWLTPMGDNTLMVAARITDETELSRARIHPINLLVTLKTYANGGQPVGYGYYNSQRKTQVPWTPVREITDALDKAFYLAFKTITPANKRTMIGVDVSGSMDSQFGESPITSAELAGAMALVTMATEPKTVVYGFNHGIEILPVSPTQSLNDALAATRSRNYGGTDASLLVREAIAKNMQVDTFIVITDSETRGSRHVYQELEKYRAKTGIAAKMIVLATESSEFTVADPKDANSLDLAGFDSATPALIAEFSRGL